MRHNENLPLELNLQFFGEEAGENDTGAADLSDNGNTNDDSVAEGNTDDSTDNVVAEGDKHVQSAEENAKYAAARRRAESEFNQRIAQRDAEFAKRFEGYENPITHQPIRSQQDYFEALDAQEKLARNEELQSKGVDPKMFEDMVNRQVANNPAVLEAQRYIEATRQAQVEANITADVKNIQRLNPNVKSIDDVLNDPQFPSMLEMIRSNSNLKLADAYKLVNFDLIMSNKNASAKQSAINNFKGTSHLNATDGVNNNDGGVDIPANELSAWKKAFPDASMSELRAKYNRSL